MEDARPYASLSSGLLARKGAAKPAMRPQSYTTFEDLGWNDMGEDIISAPEIVHPEHVPSSISALTPAPRPNVTPLEDRFDEEDGRDEDVEEEFHEEVEPAELEDRPSPVAVQHRAIRESLDIESADDGESAEDTESVDVAQVERQPKVRNRRAKAQVVSLPRPRRTEVLAGRRSAFTLRLDAERHLRLRLACAVAGRSAQQIVTEALDRALGEIPEVEALAARAGSSQRN